MLDLIPEDDAFTAGIITTAPLELKLLAADADMGLVEGYGATFAGADAYGDRIEPGAFRETLEGHRSAGTAPALLWAHDQAQPIGRLTAAGEDGRGLRIRGVLNLESEAGRKARAHLLAGDISGLSIGYQVPAGGARRGENGGRVLSKIALHEVSVVSIPADNNARVTQVKSLASRGELEQLLRDNGLSRGAARKIAAGGFTALVRDDDGFSAILEKALSDQILQLRERRNER